MNDTLKMAEWYLKIGWSLLPIIPETKKPPIEWMEFQEHQPTIEKVKEWLNKGWFLAVVTGDISGILVVDDDRPKHGLPEWGFASSVCSKSENNGRHYFFKYDRELHSHSNQEIRIDLKGWHSYALLPSFNNREWINKPSSENLAKLTPLSDDIVRLINSDTKTENGERKPIIPSDFIAISEGARNDSLHRIACSLFTKFPEDTTIQILLGINQTYSPPLTKEEFEYQVSRAKDFILNNKPEVKNLTPKTMAEIGKRRIEERKLEKLAPKTGYPELDLLIKGFIPKHIYTLTGETNIGKTAIACNFVEALRRQDKRVLYLALEPDTGFVDYMASVRTGLKFEELMDQDIAFSDPNISVFTDELETIDELKKVIETANNRYDLIVIDHIGYFVTDKKNWIQEQSNLIKQLAKFSNRSGVAILIIAHLRKPERGRKDYTPTIDDISGSAAFKQDSDEVLIVVRAKDALDPYNLAYGNTGYLYVAKTKTSGGNGVVNLIFEEKSAVIRTPSLIKRI
ncbi:MAG: DnaB-like helicase C-terminal domain-containing protein [Candidatus Gottesmanbacteria bacterium]